METLIFMVNSDVRLRCVSFLMDGDLGTFQSISPQYIIVVLSNFMAELKGFLSL